MLSMAVWVTCGLWQAALKLPSGSSERQAAIRKFSLTFVPTDVSEEDAFFYADRLAADDQEFLGLVMELRQVCVVEELLSCVLPLPISCDGKD